MPDRRVIARFYEKFENAKKTAECTQIIQKLSACKLIF